MGISPAAQSGTLLIGDELLIQHLEDNNVLATQNAVVPADGGPGPRLGFNDPYFTIEMFIFGFQLNGSCCGFYGSSFFEGIVFSDFDPSLVITGFNLRGTWKIFTPDRVSFTDTSMTFDFTNLPLDNVSVLEVDILTEPAPPTPTPIPATLALFSIGLAGLGWARRKKVLITNSSH
jgi:hypothetical protein